MAWVTKTERDRWKARYRASRRPYTVKDLGPQDRCGEVAPGRVGPPGPQRMGRSGDVKMTFADWLPRWEATRETLRRPHWQCRPHSSRNHVEPWFGKLAARGGHTHRHASVHRRPASQGLSASTVRQCYLIATSVFGTATDAGLITRTPARKITLPRLPNRKCGS